MVNLGFLGPFGPFVCAHIYNGSLFNWHCVCCRPTSIKRADKGDSSMFYITKKYKFQYSTGAYGDSGPLGLLSGPMYRIKLLAVLFLVTPIYTSTHAKKIIHVPLQLNKRIFGPPILRPPGQSYRLWPGSNTNCWLWDPYPHNGTIKPFVPFQLNKRSGLPD